MTVFEQHNPGKPVPHFDDNFVYVRTTGNRTDRGLQQYGSKLNEIAPTLIYDCSKYWAKLCPVAKYAEFMQEMRDAVPA